MRRDCRIVSASLAFVVDEKPHGRGIATALSEMLIRLAKERGLKGFIAKSLQANKKMMKMLVVIFTNPPFNSNHRARSMQNDILSSGAE